MRASQCFVQRLDLAEIRLGEINEIRSRRFVLYQLPCLSECARELIRQERFSDYRIASWAENAHICCSRPVRARAIQRAVKRIERHSSPLLPFFVLVPLLQTPP